MIDKPRKPWIAGLLTFLTIGLGHLYSGEAKKGIILYFVGQSLIIIFFLSLIFLVPSATVLILASFSGLAFLFFCVVDAVKISKKNKLTYSLKNYNKWYIYLISWVMASFIIQPIVEITIRSNIVQAYKIPSGAMKRTLQIGDHIIADKFTYKKSEPKRGDIVTFPFPDDPSKDFIKRVVALGGETIEIVDKQVIINGNMLQEPYVVHSDSKIFPKDLQPRDNFGPIKVPDDSLFVMGDNRDQSYDSRFLGFVRKPSVKGKAISVYWSWDKKTSSVRWNRIGHKIQ